MTLIPFKSLLGVSYSALWLCCLLRFIVLFPLTGRKFLSGGIADFHLGLLASTRFVDLTLYKTVMVVDLMSCVVGWIIWEHPKMARDGLYASWVCFSSIVEFYRTIKRPNRMLEMIYSAIVVLMAWNLLRVVDESWEIWLLRVIFTLGLPLTWVSTAPGVKVKHE